MSDPLDPMLPVEPIERYGDIAICGRKCRILINGVKYWFESPEFESPVAVRSFLLTCARKFTDDLSMSIRDMNRFLHFEAIRMRCKEGWRLKDE